MPKRALFKISDGNVSQNGLTTGSLAHGFFWTFQLGEENALPQFELEGTLPAAPQLQIRFEAWAQAYAKLGSASRPIGLPKSATSAPSPSNSAQTVRAACTEAAIALSQTFNQWLRHPNLLSLRETLLEQVSKDDSLRIILQTRISPIQRLPWHQWDLLEKFPQAELALSRPSYNTAATDLLSPQPKVKILAILGDSQGIDIERDRQVFEQLDAADVTFLAEPQREELNEQLWQQPWRILFFAGHSRTLKPQTSNNSNAHSNFSDLHQGEFAINPQETLSLQQLKYALKKAVSQGLQLAIFNSCDGLGLAQEFADLEIPQLIIMREPVPDRVAQTFLQYFLQTFASGQSLYGSVREARERLQGLEGEFPCATWLPIIFQNPTVQSLTWKLLQSTPNNQINQAIEPANIASTHLPAHPSINSAAHSAAHPSIDSPTDSQIEPSLAPSLHSSPTPSLNRNEFLRAHSLKALGISTAIATTLLGIRHIGFLQSLELHTYDRLIQLRPDEPPDNRILVIQVTEADIQAQKDQNPRGSLSDQSLSQLLKVLQPHQPTAIGLDIYRDYPAQLPELAQQMQDSDRLFTVCRVGEGSQPRNATAEQDTAVDPPPEVSDHRLGFSDNVLDADGMTRRHLIAMDIPADSPCQTPYPLNTMLALQYLADRGIELQGDDRGNLLLGDSQLPVIHSHRSSYQQTDPWGYQLWLNYRSHKGLDSAFSQLTLSQALASEFSPEAIRDRIILIGTTASSFRDATATPYAPQTPGVFLQAQKISQLLSAALDSRPLIWTLPRWGEGLWIISWGWMGGGLALLIVSQQVRAHPQASSQSSRHSLRQRPWRWLTSALVGFTILNIFVTLTGLTIKGIWLSPLPPLIALGGSAAIGQKLLLDSLKKSPE